MRTQPPTIHTQRQSTNPSHTDFGFLFDIDKLFFEKARANVDFFLFLRPGGVKFEPSSFKLNHEMVVLMGGRSSQGYALFQQLCVAAFLALRPHAPQLIATVQLMLGTGLPSFKGEGTIRRLRERFALGLNERHAADYMMGVVRNAHENMRSKVYDEFQRVSERDRVLNRFFGLNASAFVATKWLVCRPCKVITLQPANPLTGIPYK